MGIVFICQSDHVVPSDVLAFSSNTTMLVSPLFIGLIPLNIARVRGRVARKKKWKETARNSYYGFNILSCLACVTDVLRLFKNEKYHKSSEGLAVKQNFPYFRFLLQHQRQWPSDRQAGRLALPSG